MPGPAGDRTHRVTLLRLGAGQDEHGEDIGVWAVFGRAKAEVFWGSGNERRDAAREGGAQAASFRVLSTATTRSVTVRDRLGYAGGEWDIKGVVLRGRSEIEFNAVRAAG